MGKGHRTCEICGLKERHAGDKSLLFSKFPLEASRCRAWLKVVGNEELVHLPIEKLHDQRNVCVNHFQRKDFNKKGNRLKRHAVPTIGLMAVSLTDAQLAEFPLYVGMDKREEKPEQPEEGPFSWQQDSAVVPTDDADSEEKPEQPEEGPFSWQQDSAVVPTDDADSERCMSPMDESFLPESDDTSRNEQDPPSPADDHGVYRCNICCSQIIGFRYTCVQCPDVDLCGACEARRTHAGHYVLRIPGPRPHGEVSAMLQTIRRALLSDAIVHVAGQPDLDIEVKEENLEDPINTEHTEYDTEADESFACSVDDAETELGQRGIEQCDSETEQTIQDENTSSPHSIHHRQTTLSKHQSSVPLPANVKNFLVVEPSGAISTLQVTNKVGHVNPLNMPPLTPKPETQEHTGDPKQRIQGISVPPRILKLAAPRNLIPKLSTSFKPIILKSPHATKLIIESDSTNIDSSRKTNVKQSLLISANKRSIAPSTATQEISKKIKFKEITLMPIPDHIKQQFKNRARVCLQKPSRLEMRSPTHDKKND